MNFSLNEVHMTLRKALCGRGLAFGAADDWGAVGARLSAGGVDGIAVVLAQDNAALYRLLTEADARLATGEAFNPEGGTLQATLLAHLSGTPFDRQRAQGIAAQSWQAALDLAQNTYVPESDTSRLGGAGAGTNDND